MAEKKVFRNFDELYRHLRGKEKPIIPTVFVPTEPDPEPEQKPKKKKKEKKDEVQAD